MNPAGTIFGMPVFVSEAAYKVEIKPVRPHKKRRTQSDHYHARVQKKWNKRYGVDHNRVPVMYKMSLRSLGVSSLGADEAFVVHPSIYQQLKNTTGATL